MALILKIVAAVGLVIALAWLYFEPKFDSALAVATTAAFLIGLFVVPAIGKKKPSQSQNVSGGSVGIQASGDVNVKGDIKASKSDRRA